MLFEKKKFVISSDYCMTLDQVQRHFTLKLFRLLPDC